MASILRGNEKVEDIFGFLVLMNFSFPCFRHSLKTLQSLELEKSFQRVCAEEGVRRAGMEGEGITERALCLEKYRRY